MRAAVDDLSGPKAGDTRLHLDLAGRDPDEGMTDIAYEKGSAFLQTVESVVGRERLDAFLRDYFDHFALQPMTSARMLEYMKQKLFQQGEAERVNAQAWVFEPGIPGNLPPLKSEALAAIDARIADWKNGAAAQTLETSKWSTPEWMHFLRGLPDEIPAARLADLEKTFKLSASGNSEVLFAWLKIAIRNRYQRAFPAIERFLTSQGRRKFVAPLYSDLAKTEWGRPMAMEIYRKARPTYHAVAVTTIDQALKWNEKK
jgi:hypothetical protein